MANLKTRIEAKLGEFQKTLNDYVAVSNKTFAEALNFQMLKVVVGGKGVNGLVQLTQKTTAARIRADLARPVIRRLKGGKVFTGTLGEAIAAKFMHEKGIPITVAGLAHTLARLIEFRTEKSRAFVAASWLWAARELSKHVKGNTLTKIRDESYIPMIPGGTASEAERKGHSAIPGRLSVTVFNTSGVDKVASKAVPRALGNIKRDIGKDVARRQGEAWAREKRGK